jgi:hypothetical protein
MEVKIKYHRPQSEVKCYCCGNIKDGSENKTLWERTLLFVYLC